MMVLIVKELIIYLEFVFSRVWNLYVPGFHECELSYLDFVIIVK